MKRFVSFAVPLITNHKRTIRALVGLALPLAMAACSQDGHMGASWTLDALKTVTPTGSAFSQDLSKDYLAMAETNRAEYNWPAMSLWAHKGTVAAHGDAVAPEMVGGWSYDALQVHGVNGTFFTPDAQAASALEQARGRLVAMLATDAPNRSPEWAATAQTKFDCWLEATHEAWEATTIGACRKGFEEAMGALEAKPQAAAPAPAPAAAPATQPAAPTNYMVFFDFDKSDLKPEARRIVAAAARTIKAGTGVRIAVTGYTDTVGTVEYNLKLSFRRAQAVDDELVRDGIAASDIAVAGKGKTDLLVPTADGIREPKNRRAVIEFTQP